MPIEEGEERAKPKGAQFKKHEKIAYAKKIVERYEEGVYTLTSCCEAFGIDPEAFWRWKMPGHKMYVKEVHELFTKAAEARDINFREKLNDGARGALLRLVTGHEYEEVSTEVKQGSNGETMPVSIKKVKKQVQPNAIAVLFALKNVDSDNFKDEVHNKMDMNVTNVDNMSDEDLDKAIKEAEDQLKKSNGTTGEPLDTDS